MGVHVLGRVGHAELGEHGAGHVAEDAGGEGEVVGGGLVAVDGAAGGGDGELGVQGGEVEEDVEELVL